MTMPREWWPEERDERKMAKERSWDEKSRFEKLSAVMYPFTQTRRRKGRWQRGPQRMGARAQCKADVKKR